jgi:putative endonuclease
MEKILGEKFDSAVFGEEAACRFLKKQGLKILHRNFKTKGGEIDIVARLGQVVIFVEVKTRTNTNYAKPEDAVGFRKRESLKSAARNYIQENPFRDCEFRFDVISVTMTDSLKPNIDWIQNAF